MQTLKIGIIREGKVPPDNRTPLTPRQCHELMEKHSNVQIFAEWSAVRCYTDEDYRNFKVDIVENLDECDLLLGIKEVPVDKLVANKTYMFFSHTIKKQPHNRKLLQTILQKNIRLIDLELLTDERGNRLIGFGRWAGIVGAHYALLMLGKRTGTFDLKPAKDCINLQELVDQ
ncbi:MAG: alanine dehydrogenase, partial [Bacteroidia bacterium]